MWVNIIPFLTLHQIQLIITKVFFFISETFRGPMSTSRIGMHSKETTPTVCDRANFPVLNHSPKRNNFTTQGIRDLPLQPKCTEGLTKANSAAFLGQGFVWSVGRREGLPGDQAPAPHHLHVNGQTKAPPTPWPAPPGQPGPELCPPPYSTEPWIRWLPADIWQAR